MTNASKAFTILSWDKTEVWLRMSVKRCKPLIDQHQGPPDLEAWLKKSFRIFSFKRRPSLRDLEPGRQPEKSLFWWIGMVALILVVGFLMSGIITVVNNETVVVTRFGVYSRTLTTGTHWTIPFIEHRYLLNANTNNELSTFALMRTRDKGLVNISVALDYQIVNPRIYLFNTERQNSTLQAFLQAATLTTVEQQSLASLLATPDIKNLAAQIQANLQFNPEPYGIKIAGVRINSINVPTALSSQFAATLNQAETEAKAMQDDAKAYAAAITPIALQKALELQQLADLQKSASVITAEANAAQFKALLPMYQKDPEATAAYLPLALLPSLTSLAPTLLKTDPASKKFSVSSNVKDAYLRWNTANETPVQQ